MDGDCDAKGSNVLPFPSIREIRESGGPVSRKPKSGSPCMHYLGYEVEAESRKVSCKACGADVDAFDAMLRLAHHWDWERTRQAKREAEQEAAQLLEQVKRLRAKHSQQRRAGSLPWDAVRKVFDQLDEGLKRESAMKRGRGDKAGSEAMLDFTFYLRRAREMLLKQLDGKDQEATK